MMMPPARSDYLASAGAIASASLKVSTAFSNLLVRWYTPPRFERYGIDLAGASPRAANRSMAVTYLEGG